MKRILTMLLALVLILSCCPNVFVSAKAESAGYSELLANMDPKIKELLDSQITQEERDAIAKLDPSLSGEMLIKIYVMPFASDKKQANDMISYYLEYDKSVNPYYYHVRYYVLSDSPRIVEVRKNIIYTKRDGAPLPPCIQDIINLTAQVTVNGKMATITNLYCFTFSSGRIGETLVAIQTEEGWVFRHYVGSVYYANETCTAKVFAESDYMKYINAYFYYVASTGRDEYGHGLNGYTAPFSEFLNKYDQYMAEADEMNTKRRLVQIKQAVETHWPIGLGVVVVGGAVAIFVICRKRKKLALVAEISPELTEPIPDTIDPIPDTIVPASDTTVQPANPTDIPNPPAT